MKSLKADKNKIFGKDFVGIGIFFTGYQFMLYLKRIKIELLLDNNVYFCSKQPEKMNIQAEKIELAKLLLDTNNPKIIQSIKHIFKKEKTIDFWDDLTSEQKREIKRASLEIEQGLTTDYNTFMAKHR